MIVLKKEIHPKQMCGSTQPVEIRGFGPRSRVEVFCAEIAEDNVEENYGCVFILSHLIN